jgi:hypothetical protein
MDARALTTLAQTRPEKDPLAGITRLAVEERLGG